MDKLIVPTPLSLLMDDEQEIFLIGDRTDERLFAIGGYIYVDRELKRREERPSHRYNRSTGKVEKNDE